MPKIEGWDRRQHKETKEQPFVWERRDGGMEVRVEQQDGGYEIVADWGSSADPSVYTSASTKEEARKKAVLWLKDPKYDDVLRLDPGDRVDAAGRVYTVEDVDFDGEVVWLSRPDEGRKRMSFAELRDGLTYGDWDVR